MQGNFNLEKCQKYPNKCIIMFQHNIYSFAPDNSIINTYLFQSLYSLLLHSGYNKLLNVTFTTQKHVTHPFLSIMQSYSFNTYTMCKWLHNG